MKRPSPPSKATGGISGGARPARRPSSRRLGLSRGGATSGRASCIRSRFEVPAGLSALLPSTSRMARLGGAESILIDADRASDFLDELFRLHDARWQSRGETGVLADDVVRSFHRDAIGGLVAAGLPRLWLLRVAGQVTGAYYGFQH